MLVKLDGNFDLTENRTGLPLRCPECRRMGTFEPRTAELTFSWFGMPLTPCCYRIR